MNATYNCGWCGGSPPITDSKLHKHGRCIGAATLEQAKQMLAGRRRKKATAEQTQKAAPEPAPQATQANPLAGLVLRPNADGTFTLVPAQTPPQETTAPAPAPTNPATTRATCTDCGKAWSGLTPTGRSSASKRCPTCRADAKLRFENRSAILRALASIGVHRPEDLEKVLTLPAMKALQAAANQ